MAAAATTLSIKVIVKFRPSAVIPRA